MTAPDRIESFMWRAYKHWIFDSNDNHVFWPEELNLSSKDAERIVEEVNKALLAAEERGRDKGLEEAAIILIQAKLGRSKLPEAVLTKAARG